MALLAVGTDTKTVKGEKKGYLTGILYLAPANESGYEMCPARSKGCTQSCLFTAGRGAFSNVRAGRLNKTKRFMEQRDTFMGELVADIFTLISKAKTRDMVPCVRLNGTSDIDWERIPCLGKANIMEWFPDVAFYDYTKRLDRGPLPDNYSLTFSRSESNGVKVKKAIDQGLNVAVVFSGGLPETYAGLPVVDGDENDLRFLDGEGVIVGLKAKGKARKDTSGFVVYTVEGKVA